MALSQWEGSEVSNYTPHSVRETPGSQFLQAGNMPMFSLLFSRWLFAARRNNNLNHCTSLYLQFDRHVLGRLFELVFFHSFRCAAQRKLYKAGSIMHLNKLTDFCKFLSHSTSEWYCIFLADGLYPALQPFIVFSDQPPAVRQATDISFLQVQCKALCKKFMYAYSRWWRLLYIDFFLSKKVPLRGPLGSVASESG